MYQGITEEFKQTANVSFELSKDRILYKADPEPDPDLYKKRTLEL